MRRDTPYLKTRDFFAKIPYPDYGPRTVGGNTQRRRITMAETPKKAKTPAKPRTTTGAAKTATAKDAAPKKIAAKKRTVAEQVTATTPSREEIARLAQQFWQERGRQDGLAEQDWLRAERELMSMAS
jgi:hypothetical protein